MTAKQEIYSQFRKRNLYLRYSDRNIHSVSDSFHRRGCINKSTIINMSKYILRKIMTYLGLYLFTVLFHMQLRVFTNVYTC